MGVKKLRDHLRPGSTRQRYRGDCISADGRRTYPLQEWVETSNTDRCAYASKLHSSRLRRIPKGREEDVDEQQTTSCGGKTKIDSLRLIN